MPYVLTGPLTTVRAGTFTGGDKKSVNISMRKMFEKRARLSKEHFVVVPHKVEMILPEASALGCPPIRRRYSIILVACLADAETPLEEKTLRWRLPKKFKRSTKFEYMACAWPSETEGNSASGIGLITRLASGGSIPIENLLETASELGDAMGGLRHFYVGGNEPLVLERVAS